MLHASRRTGRTPNSQCVSLPRLLRYGLGALCGLLFLLAPAAHAQTAHSATVGWTYIQGTDAAVGFNVYRSTTSGGPYTQLNTTVIPLATLSYTDGSVVGGQTYYYVVDAQDANGVHSAYSPESLAAVIPGNPTAPTRPTVTVK